MSEKCDPFAQTHAEHLRERFAEEARQEAAAPLGQQQEANMVGPLGYPYGRFSLAPEALARLEILSMARAAPDGAAAPPIKDVIERARAYWRFVQTGE